MTFYLQFHGERVTEVLFNEAHTEGLVRAKEHPVCRAGENAMLQNDRMSVLCDVAATIRNAMQCEEISVICDHSMSFHWVTVLGDQLWLQQISMSYVCVVCCLVLACLWHVLLGVLVSVRAHLKEFVNSVKLT